MTDINEAIARWMGHTGDGPANIPYDLSLDLQVPVWEALDVGDLQLATLTNGGWRATLNVLGHTGDYVEDGDETAEAAARAIHAALVALGEVRE